MNKTNTKVINEELSFDDRNKEIELSNYDIELLQELYLSCPSVKEGIKRIYLLGVNHEIVS